MLTYFDPFWSLKTSTVLRMPHFVYDSTMADFWTRKTCGDWTASVRLPLLATHIRISHIFTLSVKQQRCQASSPAEILNLVDRGPS